MPFRQPDTGEAEGVGGDFEIEANRTRTQHLLPFGDFVLWFSARHHADHQRRHCQTAAFLFEFGCARVRMCLRINLGNDFASLLLAFTLEHNETKRHDFAVVGDAGRKRQEQVALLDAGGTPRHRRRRRRAALLQKLNHGIVQIYHLFHPNSALLMAWNALRRTSFSRDGGYCCGHDKAGFPVRFSR